MLYALLHEINKLFPNDIFVVYSGSKSITIPPETEKKVKFIKPYALFFEIPRSSFFIIGGGTSIFDYTKNKLFNIFVILLYFEMLILAKIFCKKMLYLSIGVGSVSSRFGQYLIKKMYGLADYITVRDSRSLQLLRDMNIEDKIKLSFDLAAFLQVPTDKHNTHNVKRVLGVSILPFYQKYHNNKKKDLAIVNNIETALRIWLEEHPDNMVHLFSFQGKSENSINDVEITDCLYKKLLSSNRVKMISYNPDPLETLLEIEKCDAFLGMRYHSLLFAYLVKKPFVMIDYSSKCKAFAEDINLPDSSIISINEVLNEKLGTYIEDLLKNPNKLFAQIPPEEIKKRLVLFDEEILEEFA
jgi:polysaccharide pyruvyl transferase WcaK-like protein